jgi:phospholipid transport system substrate-binding protein
MFRRLGFAAAFFGAMVLALGTTAPVIADDLETGSSKFISSLAENAIGSLASKETERNERINRFRAMFVENFAVRSIGKFVLGRFWKKASEEERKEYLGLFEDLMVVSYVDRFAQYAGEALKVKSARAEKKNTATVFSLIERPGGAKAIRVNWRVGTNGKIYKILDVVVEGTSMSNTLRSDFSSIVRRKGGKVAGLIEELRIKTAALKVE